MENEEILKQEKVLMIGFNKKSCDISLHEWSALYKTLALIRDILEAPPFHSKTIFNNSDSLFLHVYGNKVANFLEELIKFFQHKVDKETQQTSIMNLIKKYKVHFPTDLYSVISSLERLKNSFNIYLKK